MLTLQLHARLTATLDNEWRWQCQDARVARELNQVAGPDILEGHTPDPVGALADAAIAHFPGATISRRDPRPPYDPDVVYSPD